MLHQQQEVSQQVQVVNSEGLHCRPAHKIHDAVAPFEALVTITSPHGSADARSVFDLLMLQALKGTTLHIRGSGRDAQKAVEAVVEVIRGGFGEE